MHLTLVQILRLLEKLKKNSVLLGTKYFIIKSCDIKGDRKLDQETTYYNSYYKLPDQRVIQINKEKFEAPEILFNPSLIANESDSAPELVFNCINVTKKLKIIGL